MSPREQILDHALRLAPFDGWTRSTVEAAARAAGLPDGSAALYFPEGELGLIDYWHRRTLEAVEAEIAARGLANMKVRDRVREGVLVAMEAIGPYGPAMRRALNRLALPDAGTRGPRQAWEMADAIWRGIGDTSTDFNYYTKRTILSGVIGSALLAWLNDTSSDKAEARAFLDRRLADVMRFEGVKARARALRDGLPNPAELLGRARFGSDGPMSSPFGRPSTKRRRRRAR